MIGKMTSNTECNGGIFHQCELLDASSNYFAWRMLLNIGSRCRVSPQNDFLNVLATHMIEQMTLNIESNCKVSLQCELSYVFSTLV
jgi:hypothetical protein